MSIPIHASRLLRAALILLLAQMGPASYGSDHHGSAPPPAAPAHAAAAPHSEHPVGAAPEAVLAQLKEGNSRFEAGKLSHPHADVDYRKQLSGGQHPEAIILSCSDSRVAPELLFDKGLGDLFVVRDAGNILGAAAVASMEYAVEHLGSRLIVVMGHESCGAVKAALSTPPGKSAGSPDLDSLVATIQGNLEAEGKDGWRSIASEDKTLRGHVSHNVNAVAKRLTERSKIIRNAVETGKVKIVPAIYGLETGHVDFWEFGEARKPASAHGH